MCVNDILFCNKDVRIEKCNFPIFFEMVGNKVVTQLCVTYLELKTAICCGEYI